MIHNLYNSAGIKLQGCKGSAEDIKRMVCRLLTTPDFGAINAPSGLEQQESLKQINTSMQAHTIHLMLDASLAPEV